MCPPCDNELKSEAIIEHLCASEFGKLEVQPHAGLLESPPFPVPCLRSARNMELMGGASCSSLTSSASFFLFSVQVEWSKGHLLLKLGYLHLCLRFGETFFDGRGRQTWGLGEALHLPQQ